jgi:DtxR family Mn-dependent transcriptional regulator
LSSHSLEEYLESIYHFNEKGELAKNSELAKRLRVAPPSVTQMVQKLADEGYVNYTPYKGAILTGKGMAIAQNVVRKHRLLERFLHDTLGFGKDRVHEEACRMEHSLSDEAAIALCRVLDKPERCPDDEKLIPFCPLDVESCGDCEASRPIESLQSITQLSNLKPGEKGEVAHIRAGTTAQQRLLDMGLTRGTEVEVINSAPFNGPIEISVRDTYVAIGRGLASLVIVRLFVEDDLDDRIHPHGPHH